MDGQQRWLSVMEAAQLYRVTVDTMKKWVRKGLVPSVQNGTEVRVPGSVLYAALRQRPRPVGAQLHEQ